MLSFLHHRNRSPTIKSILRENIDNDVIILEDIENEENNTTIIGKKSSKKLARFSQMPKKQQLPQNNATLDIINSGSNNQSPIRTYKKVFNSKNSFDSSAFFDLNSTINQSYARNNRRTFSTQSNSSVSGEQYEKNKNKSLNNNEYILSQEPIIKLQKITNNNEDKESINNDDKVTIYSKDLLRSKENILLSKGTNSEVNTVSNFSIRTKKIKKLITPSKDYLDDFDYESALLYDNRTFCKCYYLSLLTTQNILSTFVL